MVKRFLEGILDFFFVKCPYAIVPALLILVFVVIFLITPADQFVWNQPEQIETPAPPSADTEEPSMPFPVIFIIALMFFAAFRLRR